MSQGSKHTVCSVVAAVMAIVAPFLLAASAIVAGIAAYLVFRPGPNGREPGLTIGWEVVASSWPLFVSAILLAVIGFFSLRHMGRPDQG
jgi:hypothetical protein